MSLELCIGPRPSARAYAKFKAVIPAKAGTPKGSPLGNPGEGCGLLLNNAGYEKTVAIRNLLVQ